MQQFRRKPDEKSRERLNSIISTQLPDLIEKFTRKRVGINLHQYLKSHDRFLIIDGKDPYHIGASLKDLGKKWFAFSRMDSLCKDVLRKLEGAM